MACFEVKNLKFQYPGQPCNVLDGINLKIEQGEFVVLFGMSGCGKSTFLRHLKPVLTPCGVTSGEILFNEVPLYKVGNREQASKIGFVLQSPENQIVTDKVWHELAFGLENLGCDVQTIRQRTAETASFFGIDDWFHKNVSELSGGQKQLLVLASTMAMQPSVLILDEPTSMLDPISASNFLNMLWKINHELGTTIIITEHRLEEVLPMSNHVFAMDGGKILCEGTAPYVGQRLKTLNHPMFQAMPVAMQIYSALPNDLECPVTVCDGRAWLDKYSKIHMLNKISLNPDIEIHKNPVITLKDVWFRYESKLPDTVKGLSLTVHSGDFLAIMGSNGAGKTTTLSLILGLLKPYRGKITVNGKIAMLQQNLQTMFVQKTVQAELLDMSNDVNAKNLDYIIKICKISNLMNRHPYDLSGGEQQRTALAKILMLNPEILLLDEPTKSIDAQFKHEFAEILQHLQKNGTTIVMVSHDVEFAAQYAKRCCLFFDGHIIVENTPRAFFANNNFYTTSANRMARHVLPNAITANDIIKSCGGKEILNLPETTYPVDEKQENLKKICPTLSLEQVSLQIPAKTQSKGTNIKQNIILIAIMCFLIPLTIYIGINFFGDRKYHLISLLVFLQTAIPFLIHFEKRKPQARELVIISVMCAITIVGRAVFFMIPQFKPVIALIIISGTALGCQSGFLIGSVAMLASNIIFGQGPWTPWQMFAMGIIGFLSGMLFKKNHNRILLSTFGAIVSVLIYGFIMNSANVFISQPSPTISMFLVSYLVGLPFDLIQAVTTFIFLWFTAIPMLEKINRIKIKYKT